MRNLLAALCSSLSLTAFTAYAADVGVFYYPGWDRPNIDAWEKIKPYPERKPLLGWYKEGSDQVTKTHLKWMDNYGVNFIAYDWYWDQRTGVENRTYAIDSYIRNSKESNVEFALLWANHTNTPESREQFDEIIDYWIVHYFKNSKYKKIDNEPIVFIFSPDRLTKDAAKFGATPKELLARARDAAKRAGLNGIYFIGSAESNKNAVSLELPTQTYDAISSYNYQYAPSESLENRVLSKSYDELSAGYLQTWSFILKNSPLPYVIPVTSGWDKTPWGGSQDPLHDRSFSTPEQFSKHLKQARQVLINNPTKTINTIVICCWNEFGEGSYIEPTKKFGFKYLEQVKSVLK